jgi:8-oxo-dGTP diphosphatase
VRAAEALQESGQTPTSVRVQLVPLRVRAGRLEVQVHHTAQGWSFPGTAPDAGESMIEAAARAGQELGLPGAPLQLGAFGRPQDGVSVAFLHLVRPPLPGSGGFALSGTGSSWWDVRAMRPVRGAEELLRDALDRLRQEVEHGIAGFHLVGAEFTVSELRRVHEAVLRVSIDPSNFRKRVARWVEEGTAVELSMRRPTATRPARLYRLLPR